MKKILIAAVSLIVIIGITLAVLIKIYVTPENVKAYIIPRAEESLNRKVTIGSIDINLLKGIGLKEFTIKESDGETDFVRCSDFVLKFQLLPLLTKRVIIDELKVVSPSVRIERDKKGAYNFEDIGRKDAPKEKSKEVNGEAEKGLPISLLVSKISVTDAKFSLTDLMKTLPDVKSSADVDISIKSADGSEIVTEGSIKINIDEAVLRKPEKHIQNISGNLTYAVTVNLQSDEIFINKAEVEIQKITASLKGAVRKFSTSPEFDISLNVPKAKTADIQALAALFADLKDVTLSGAVAADLKIQGSMDNLDAVSVGSSVALDKVGIKYKDIETSLDGDLNTVLKADNLTIEKADLKAGGIPVSIKGNVTQLKTSPNIDVALMIPRADAGKFQVMLAPFVKMKGAGLSGYLAADVTVKGATQNLESMNAKGSVTLEKLGIASDGISALLDGTIKIDGKTMTIDLTGSSGKNTAILKGTVSSLFRNQAINIDLYSKRLFLDEVIPMGTGEAAPSSGAPGNGNEKSTPQGEAEPLTLTLTAGGEVKIDSAIYKGMHMTDFYMQYLFRNNRLDIVKMTANAGKGKFELSSSADLSKPGYTYDLAAKIDSLHAEEIVNAFFPKAKDKVFGTITSNLKLNGRGTLPASVKKNLLGDADFDIKDGKITDAEIARELSLFLNVGELETIKFTKAGGTVKISNGAAKLDSMFSSSDFSMDPKGTIGLDETLDLAFELKLSPRLTDKAITSKIGKYMKDEGGWGTIPVLVTGTFSDPKYGVDIAKAGQRVIERKVDKILDKLLKKGGQEEQPQKEQKPQTEPDKQPQEQGNQLQDMLQQLPGLFGK